MSDVDAIVIGSGPNGLVAANALARHGWRVLVCEAADQPGGGVRSEEATLPGYIHDHCAAFFPLAVSSPHFRALDLEGAGVRWLRAPVESAHPRIEGLAARLVASVEESARGMGEDEREWRNLMSFFGRVNAPLMDMLLHPLPKIGALARMGMKLKIRGGLDFTQLALMPARDLGATFAGPGPGQIITSLALHADVTPESAGSALLGLILAYGAQTDGFPVPEGGAGRITDAMLRRLAERAGEVRRARVSKVLVRGTRAVGATIDGFGDVGVRHAVIADTGPGQLFHDLVGEEHLPSDFIGRLKRFRYGPGIFKVDWALDGPVPWADETCRRAAVVHVGEDVDDMSRYMNEVVRGLIPSHPYLLLGQQSVADPSRGHTLWGYTHVPSMVDGGWTAHRDAFADAIEERIERYAPGFRASIKARRILDPSDFERGNANLVGGEHNGGTGQLYAQLVFRPAPGWFRYRTPIRGLYLGSASAHPGGGVHGACGAGAATMALRDRRFRKI